MAVIRRFLGIKHMSFQAYLDNIEAKTGKTPEQFIALAKKQGFTPKTKSGDIVAWLKKDFALGHGHAMALVFVIKKGANIGDKHVATKGTHSDPTNTLILTGAKKAKAKKVVKKKGPSKKATSKQKK